MSSQKTSMSESENHNETSLMNNANLLNILNDSNAFAEAEYLLKRQDAIEKSREQGYNSYSNTHSVTSIISDGNDIDSQLSNYHSQPAGYTSKGLNNPKHHVVSKLKGERRLLDNRNVTRGDQFKSREGSNSDKSYHKNNNAVAEETAKALAELHAKYAEKQVCWFYSNNFYPLIIIILVTQLKSLFSLGAKYIQTVLEMNWR